MALNPEAAAALLSDSKVWNRGIRHIMRKDKVMARTIRSVGSFAFEADEGTYYESLVEAILFQQLAGSAARAILKKFKALYKGRIPTPRQYLGTRMGRLRSAGISPQKYAYIKDLCERMEDGRLGFRGIDAMPDHEIITMLDEVKGIGRWTAEMFLLFNLGRTDVVPMDDLGFRKGLQKAYRLRSLPAKDRMEGISSAWRPYGSIATLYLWRSLDKTPK